MARLVSFAQCKSCWTCKRSPLDIVSPANHDIDIRFRWRHCDGSCVSEGTQKQICIFDIISLWNAICVPICLCVSIFLIAVTELCDMIICLWMNKSRTHHAKGLESKSSFMTANTFDFCLPITIMWVTQSYISEDIYYQNFSEWCHTSHRKVGQYSWWIWLNDDHCAAFIHVSNCVTLHTDLVHMVEIFEIAYGTWLKLRRRSWMRNGEDVEL